MGFVEKFNFFGTEARQIPCIRGEGAPTTETEGEVGCLYMDTLTGEVYKCVAVADGVHTWVSTKDYVTPEMYGAKGDGKTDDTAALQAAFDSGYTVYLGKKSYRITETLVISKNKTIIRGEGTIEYGKEGAAIKLSACNVELDLYMVSNTKGTGLLVESDTTQIDRNRVNIKWIYSAIGLHLATGMPIIYNEFKVEQIRATDVGILLWEDNSRYIAENAFYINRIIGCNAAVILHNADSNKFFNVGFEGVKNALSDTSEYTSALTNTCSIYLDNADANVFRTCRMSENYGQKCIVFNGSCTKNDIEVSRITVSQLDYSRLTEEDSRNILRVYNVGIAESSETGPVLMVSGKLGLTYDIRNNNLWKAVTLANFPDKVLGRMSDNVIPTFYSVADEDLAGETFTLHGLFSDAGSLARGASVCFYFNSRGNIKLVDNKGHTIFDNTDGSLMYKHVSVRWLGYAQSTSKNLWDVTVLSI